MCTTLAVRLMSGEGPVNFDRHVCLCLLTTSQHPRFQCSLKFIKINSFACKGSGIYRF